MAILLKSQVRVAEVMSLFIALLGWLTFSVAAHGAPHISSSHGEAAARRVCSDRARAAHHRVLSVRSVEKQAKDHFRVMLRVAGTKRLLTCNYDGRSGGAQLHW
jgi:hypothetical protein